MSKELEKTYNPGAIEERLYDKWMEKKYFHAEVDRSKKPFTIVMPPPNITGQLHMGHALDNTMQDILIRYKRMQGYSALWQKRGHQQRGSHQRGILKVCLGLEEGVRRTDRKAVKEAGILGRLGQRAVHHGRGLLQCREGSIYPSV